MAPEIDWTRSLKNKLQIWRGSKRRPKSIKKIPVLSPAEYRQQWPFLKATLHGLRHPFCQNKQQRALLAGYADRLEENFGPEVEDDSFPDPFLDALPFTQLGLITFKNYETTFPKTWFSLGGAYAIEVVVRWLSALSLVSFDSTVSVPEEGLELTERELLRTVRRLLGSLSSEDYEAALEVASGHFSDKNTSLETRAHLAYLFPDQMAWGNAVIDDLPQLSEKAASGADPVHRSHTHFLMFASGADVEHLHKLIACCDPRELDPGALLSWWSRPLEQELDPLYALLDRFEKDARVLLLSLLDLPWTSPPDPIIEMLCHIPHQDVFDELVVRFSGVNAIPIAVRELFISYPEMGLAAMTSWVERGEGLGEGLTEVYGELQHGQARLAAEAENTLGLATREDFTGVFAAPPWHGGEDVIAIKTVTKRFDPLDDTVYPHESAEVDGSNKLENLESWVRNVTSKKDVLDACALVSWSGLAPKVAELLGTKTMRDGALEWVEANPRDAAIGGIPAYLGTRGAKKRKHLSELLRSARQADEEVFDEVVDAYAEKHGEELRDFLPDFEDATAAYPKKMPELPAFWNPAAYPPILLEKDLSKRIPTDICDDIALMLAFSPPGKPYVGLLELEEQADATSLGEFAWGVFESWIRAGAPLDEEWVIRGLALFGGPEVASELPYMLDAWLCSSSHKRGEKVIDAISIGCNAYTLEALWCYLHGGHKREGIERVTKKLEEVLGAKQETDFEPHFDRSAPTFGIGKDHRIKLGGASGQGLKVWLDEDLEPHLSDSGAGFDELDEPTRLRWERLGRLCAWQARFQSRRFERAMRTQRAWSIEDWQNDILEHPLLGMLAHKLLWGVYREGELVGAFRVDEEGRLADIEDDNIELFTFADHAIRIVHPLHLADEQKARWVQLFADYEVIQPFDQLTRKTWEAEEAEALVRGGFASFNSTMGAMQRMFEDHGWADPINRQPSAPISKITRRLSRRGAHASVEVTIDMNWVDAQVYYPGVSADDARPVRVEVSLGHKKTDCSRLSKIDLSELIWELARAMRR